MGIIQKILNSSFVEKNSRKAALFTGLHFRLKRLSASASEEFRTVKILNTHAFNKVLDIGANTGQFAESLLDFRYGGEIISFEPVSSAYAVLQKKSRKYKNWTIAEKCAVGNYMGEITINVSENTLFSSVKAIRNDYAGYNKESRKTSSEKVKVLTIDSLKNKYFREGEMTFLKIDTQGFEKEVMEGARESLQCFMGIKMEIPLQPIYEDVEWSIKDIINYLYERGFKCVSLNPVAVNNKTGVVHEVDGIFLRD